jgi:cell division protein FtsN
MSDPDRDRGAYTPSGEEPFAFDAREQDERGAGKPPTTLVVSALVLMVLVAGLFVWMYRGGARKPGQPPVVGAPLSDIKQPPPSAQSSDAAAGLQIYSAEEAPQASSGPPNFAPSPEQPLPRLPPPASSAPAAPPVAQAPASPPAAATPAPAPVSPRPATPTPAPAPAAPAAPAAAGAVTGPVVQIGAFSSPSLADKGWNDVARLLPGEMVGKTKRVEAVAKDASTLYRAYVGGFATKAEASAFCDQLKAASHSCFVK